MSCAKTLLSYNWQAGLEKMMISIVKNFFSLRIKDENIVIRRGAIKNIAVHSAIGRETIPRKKNKLAKTKSMPLNKWAKGLLVFSALRPPSKGKKRIKGSDCQEYRLSP